MRDMNRAVLLPGLAAVFFLSGPANAQSGPRFRADPAFMTEDDYPPLAARENREGRVSLGVGVDATGRVTSCSVLASSGHEDLDAQSCFLMMRRGRYAPARDAAGNSVPGRATQNIRWKLPEMDTPPAYTSSSPAYAPAYVPAPYTAPAPVVSSGGQQAPAMSASQQMNADLQRNAAELLARKKK